MKIQFQKKRIFRANLTTSFKLKNRPKVWHEYKYVLGRFHVQVKETKGGRWMPWLWKAMKDVASCEKPR